ncbi:phage tail protein [Stutzerimonas stutzeri]|uniref:phage tail protein n=1 Tax=Stutzerimonas stutzeri TaxID=316 RepID=UPI00244BED3E|nr:phage tail protein [Stutzerimonas stutzeri]MDH1590530.1 phage tail protein [Stutzerimonas stutzeri]
MSTVIAYQFDAAGFYRGETTADESPLEPGVFLLPARCTSVPPPADVPEERWPRWNGAAWVLVNKPAALATPDPVVKLREFLAENPDVAALIAG